MSRYIGLDVHATSCTLAVVGKSGRQLGSQVVETNGSALLEAIKAVPRPRYLCIEEGTPSAWLYEVLSPAVDQMVVTQQSRKSTGNKSDKLDAFGLATGLLKGTLPRRIYKAPRVPLSRASIPIRLACGSKVRPNVQAMPPRRFK